VEESRAEAKKAKMSPDMCRSIAATQVRTESKTNIMAASSE
jgi:hypothetical protein